MGGGRPPQRLLHRLSAARAPAREARGCASRSPPAVASTQASGRSRLGQGEAARAGIRRRGAVRQQVAPPPTALLTRASMAAAVPVPPDGWQADTPLPSPSPAAAPLTPPAGALRGLLAPGLDTTHVAAATPPPMTATGSSPDDCLARCECDALLGAHPRPRANDTEAGPLDTSLPSSSLLSPVRAAAAVLFTILWAGALLALACLALWLAARYAMPPVPEYGTHTSIMPQHLDR